MSATITLARARLSSLTQPDLLFEEDFIVDIRSILSFAPASKLRAIGVEPTRVDDVRLVDGSLVRRPVGDVFFEVAGKCSAMPVIFGEPGDPSLIGYVTLAALALTVEPDSKELFDAALRAPPGISGPVRTGELPARGSGPASPPLPGNRKPPPIPGR